MPYAGQTYRISLLDGGLNGNPNTDLLPPYAFTDCRNINLHRGIPEARGGTVKVNGTPIAGNPKIMGLYQFIKKNGDSYIISACSNGTIQKDYTTELKSGLATNKFYTFETFNDKLYICNGANRPQVWDGISTTTSDLVNIPTDWTGTNYPKIILLHGVGTSQRLWALGCPNNPHKIYVSALGTDDFSDANVLVLNKETGDGYGIVGAIEFGDRLFLFGKRKTYYVDDSDTNTANWKIIDAQWSGGAAHHRLLVKTPNDIIAMTEDGDIYSVFSATEYGDYKSASLVRPAYIHIYIANNFDLTKIANFHSFYDSNRKAVIFFMVRNGQTTIDASLAYFIDRPPDKAWSRLDNEIYTSGYNASSACMVRVTEGDYRVYTGDYSGYVWQLETSTFNDNGKYYRKSITLSYADFDNPRQKKRYDRGWVVIKPANDEIIKINLYLDGKIIRGQDFIVDENGNYLVDETGMFVVGDTPLSWSVQAVPDADLINKDYAIGAIGNRIKIEFYNDEVNKGMAISQVLYDYMPFNTVS